MVHYISYNDFLGSFPSGKGKPITLQISSKQDKFVSTFEIKTADLGYIGEGDIYISL
jgi:hypothetical protein